MIAERGLSHSRGGNMNWYDLSRKQLDNIWLGWKSISNIFAILEIWAYKDIKKCKRTLMKIGVYFTVNSRKEKQEIT